MKKVLTIIIPTYNMERYLDKCLSSIVVKDERLMNILEVLVINDGSKDNSSQIAHKFEANYPTTFRVIDKENGNYGSCINRGLKESTGKYIKVLDADDYFNNNNFVDLIKVLERLDVDLIVSDFELVNEDGRPIARRTFSFPCNKEFIMEEYVDSLFTIEMHAVIYRRELLLSLNYQQLEGLSYTDSEWVFSPLTKVSSVFYYDKIIYEYLVGRSGQTVDLSIITKKAPEREVIVRKLISFYESYRQENEDKKIMHFLTKRIMLFIHGQYLAYLLINRDTQRSKAFDEFLRSSSPYLYGLSNNITIHHRYMPYHYVAKWRKKGHLPHILLTKLYRTVKRIK